MSAVPGFFQPPPGSLAMCGQQKAGFFTAWAGAALPVAPLFLGTALLWGRANWRGELYGMVSHSTTLNWVSEARLRPKAPGSVLCPRPVLSCFPGGLLPPTLAHHVPHRWSVRPAVVRPVEYRALRLVPSIDWSIFGAQDTAGGGAKRSGCTLSE